MSSRMQNRLGSITIEDKVVANIACNSAMETYGIVGMAAKNTKDGIYELLGLENMTRGVAVVSEDTETISIELSVIMEYGIRIAVVAENVIEKIKYNVESLTGLTVSAVHLVVQGIRV